MAKQLVHAYLIAYNGSMLLGWLLVACRTLDVLRRGGSVTKDVFPAVVRLVKSLLLASCLETVHAGLGFVRSPVVTTAIQAFVRLFAFSAGMNSGSAVVASGIAANATVLAWTASEVIRYAFYLSNLVQGSANGGLQWLRYSAFIVLYPIGVLGEVGSLWGSVPHLEKTGAMSVMLPNALNFSFWMPHFIRAVVVLTYPYGFYVMYTYMLSQRRKVLGRSK